MVGETGVEPARPFGQQIFLLLYVTIADKSRCSLEHVFTIANALGGWCMSSTHLFGTIFSSIRISKSMAIRT